MSQKSLPKSIERIIKSKSDIDDDVYMLEIFVRTYNDLNKLKKLAQSSNIKPYLHTYNCKILSNHDIDIISLKNSFPKQIECVKYIDYRYIIGILKNGFWFVLTPQLEVHVAQHLSEIKFPEKDIKKFRP